MVWCCECSQWQLFTDGQVSTYHTRLYAAHVAQSCRNKAVPCLVWCLQQYEPGACVAPLLCCQPASHHQTPLEKHQQKCVSSFSRARSIGRTATSTGDGWHRSPSCIALAILAHVHKGLRGMFPGFLIGFYTVIENYTKSFLYEHIRLKSETPEDGNIKVMLTEQLQNPIFCYITTYIILQDFCLIYCILLL